MRREIAPQPAPNSGANRSPQLSVIIPTFNEVRNIPILVARLNDVLSQIDWEVIFVDDDSPDGTAAAVHEIARIDSRVRCIRLM